jgi:hypothetical protein
MAGIAAKKRGVLWVVILFTLLTLIGLDSVYWLLFFIWRSAAQPADNTLWRPRIYAWLAASIITGVAWIALLIWTVRHRRNSN